MDTTVKSTRAVDPPEQNTISVRDERREIDALLCTLHRTASALHGNVEASRRTAPARASHIVDFSPFESRARQISTLRHLHAELQKLTAVVAHHGREADALHQEELTSMQEYIDTTCRLDPRDAPARPPRGAPARAPRGAPRDCSVFSSLSKNDHSADVRGVPWKDEALTARVLGLTRRGRAAAALGADTSNHNRVAPPRTAPSAPAVVAALGAEPLPRSPPAPDGQAPAHPRCKIVMDDLVSLDAVIIPETLEDPREIFAAVTTPELYYIARWDHFAVRCGAVVFHGNVGQVYSAIGGRPLRAPVRVKECRLRGACPSLARGSTAPPPCAYYHDPGECPGSKDVRNFVADSWVYTPVTTRYSARYGSRRLGSRDALRGDLQEISASDARRHLAQTAHDIICSVILAKYVLAPGNP